MSTNYNTANKTMSATTAEIKLCCLLSSIRKSVEFWCLVMGQRHQTDADDYTDKRVIEENNTLLEQIVNNCTKILLHDLQLDSAQKLEDKQHTTDLNSENLEEDFNATFHVFIKDFEYLRKSAQMRDLLTDRSAASSLHICNKNNCQNVKNFISSWVLRNINSNCLVECIQALVDNEKTIETYYDKSAFLRNKKYVAGLLICLTAFELKQHSLLSQIDTKLKIPTVAFTLEHQQCSNSVSNEEKNETKLPITSTPDRPNSFQTVFRKIKSLPMIQYDNSNTLENKEKCLIKAFNADTANDSTKKNLCVSDNLAVASSSNASSSTYNSGDEVQPSRSFSSKKTHLSSFTLNSISNSTIASNSDSFASTNSKHIELIKCDDIKIWTDQSFDIGQLHNTPKEEIYAIPKNPVTVKTTKSFSPIGSFLANLFNTPPTYTSWSFSQSCNASFQEATNPLDNSVKYPYNAQPLVSNSVFDSFLPIYGKKLRTVHPQSLFEDGISTLDYSQNANCLNPQANTDGETVTDNQQDASIVGCTNTQKNGQSLTTFLQMSHLSRNNTQLEKENAHFRVSEAIISAIEHVKWTKSESVTETENVVYANEDCIETKTENETPTTEITEHLPYAELGENCLDLLSAEGVGLSLISKFNDTQLPKVSELKWLVSEEDVPQQLLPLPDNSLTQNPDENIVPPLTRGTRYWAPPRQQIIFTDHPHPNRKQLLKTQNNRCAGCGMVVALQYIHTFRYCTYLGKYHCTGCHRNQISATPAKILHMWDFNCYPVSVFAYRLLEQMYTFPLFYVPDLNPDLYKRQKVLLTARNKRVQLRYVKEFIKSCRFAEKERAYFDTIPDYITGDPDIWSMSDFIDARNKSMQYSIDELINTSENHIFNCVLCTARGFFCEFCRKEQIIYPWRNKIVRCDRCGSCFHLNCWKSMLEICCRCQRLDNRYYEMDEI